MRKIAAEKDVLILTDEIYEAFCYDGPCHSIAAHHENVLVLRGFSKSYAMTGWRLGYVAAHESLRPIIEEMTKIQQYTFVCVPTPFQKAAVAALDYDVTSSVDSYRKKETFSMKG